MHTNKFENLSYILEWCNLLKVVQEDSKKEYPITIKEMSWKYMLCPLPPKSKHGLKSHQRWVPIAIQEINNPKYMLFYST